jgi:hypothetical protein
MKASDLSRVVMRRSRPIARGSRVKQLALIDRLTTHHDRPVAESLTRRNHDSSLFTKTFSTASVNCDLPGSCGHDRFCLNAGHLVVP